MVCSDVIYLPECVEPLFKSLKYFLKKDTGKCLFVNNRIRIDIFSEEIARLLQELNFEILEDNQEVGVPENEDMKFRVVLLKHSS